MKKFLALFLIFCLPALAGPSEDALYDRCAEVMALGSCAALADPGTLTAEELARKVKLIGPSGAVRVTYASLLRVRGLGSVSPTDLRMCQAARTFCLTDPAGEECAVARAFWGK
jgi:hypothetical protein